MLSLTVLNFIIVIYSNTSQLTYTLIGPLAVARRVLSMNKDSPSFCLEVLLELALSFFLEISMVTGAHVVLCMTEADFLKIIVLPQKWGKIGQA